MRPRRIGEDALVAGIAARFGSRHPRLIKGIGDDTCVVRLSAGKALLATTDILIENTHFKRSYTPPFLLGRKSLSISLSDIAAMGGAPLFYLVSVALPPGIDKKFVDEIYRGLAEAARESGAILAGGNTARTEDGMVIETTVFGEAAEDEVLYRSTARPGDIVFVTGTLGSSALGLKVLSNHGPDAIRRKLYRDSITRHLDPTPRLKAGRALAASGLVTAMMDISDGVGLDLKRLCEASGKAAVIHLSALPITDELSEYGERTGKSSRLDFALTGGEDYELLFTAPEDNMKRFSALSKKLSLPFTPIGRIIPKKKAGRTITVIDEDGRPLKLKRLGFEHF